MLTEVNQQPAWWPLPAGQPIGEECAGEMRRWICDLAGPLMTRMCRLFWAGEVPATITMCIHTADTLRGQCFEDDAWGFHAGSVLVVRAGRSRNLANVFELILTMDGTLALACDGDEIELIDPDDVDSTRFGGINHD